MDESTKVSDRKTAEALRIRRESEIVNRQVGGSRAVATFLEAAVGYFESGGETRFAKRIVEHFATWRLAEIGQAEVDACARKLYPRLSPASINRLVFTPVSAILTHAARRRLCDKPSFERPTQPRGRVRWLEYSEADALIAAAGESLRPLLTFLFFTGCRVGEALALDWREVDLSRAHVVFEDTKNGDRRGVPLHPRALAALANLRHREGRVFRRPDKQPYAEKPDGGGQIKTAFKGACKRAGIKDFHPHDCRHTWATWYYRETRDIAGLMRLGGWKTISMVTRYAHVNASDLAGNVAKLGENPGTSNHKRTKKPGKQRRSA